MLSSLKKNHTANQSPDMLGSLNNHHDMDMKKGHLNRGFDDGNQQKMRAIIRYSPVNGNPGS